MVTANPNIKAPAKRSVKTYLESLNKPVMEIRSIPGRFGFWVVLSGNRWAAVKIQKQIPEPLMRLIYCMVPEKWRLRMDLAKQDNVWAVLADAKYTPQADKPKTGFYLEFGG